MKCIHYQNVKRLMAILYDWYENPGESNDSEEKGLHPRIF